MTLAEEKANWIKRKEELEICVRAAQSVKIDMLDRGVFLPFAVVMYSCIARIFAIRKNMLDEIIKAPTPKGVIVPRDPEQIKLEQSVYKDKEEKKEKEIGKESSEKKKKKKRKLEKGDDIDSIFSMLD